MSNYVIKVELSNPEHPEFGVAAISFPLFREEYPYSLGQLSEIGIGDVLKSDCLLTEVSSFYPVLQALNGTLINVDELDYLAKRLDGLSEEDAEKFEAMASAQHIQSVKDFINLTFCCQGTTVISDFSDLEQTGKDHALTIHGGSMPTDEYEAVDGKAVALELIAQGDGRVTPYGVLFDNGVKLEEVYSGGAFPKYLYDPDVILSVSIGSAEGLCLPMAKTQLDRFIQRAGLNTIAPEFQIQDVFCYGDVLTCLDMSRETLDSLNEMCLTLAPLDKAVEKKLSAVCEYVKPLTADQLAHLASNLDLFDYVEGVATAEEYGKYMIRESDYYEYDPELEPFYDFKRYGEMRLDSEQGAFVSSGYVSYAGDLSLGELMQGGEAENGLEMGQSL